MDTDAREREIVWRLRAVIAAAQVVAIVAMLVGNAYDLLLVAALFVPAPWVFWRPRWGQIMVWIMWAVPVLMLSLLISLDRTPVMTASHALVGIVVALVVVVLPFVRRGHRPPPMPRNLWIPEARLVRRSHV
jgi:hypothetical protein